MKRKIVLAFPILCSLSLASCGGNPNNPKVLKNGELFGLSEINDNNAYVNATFDYMDTMVQSGEPFIFYLTNAECSACYNFKGKILSYVSSTKNLVARMDIWDIDKETYTEDFKHFTDKYGDYFFINGQALTPQVYIVEGLKFETQVPFSRYENEGMFKRAMGDYINECSVYSFTTCDSINRFLEKNPHSLCVLIDRTNKEIMDTYHGYVQDLIKTRNSNIALIEINDSNRSLILERFALEELTAPTGFIEKDSQIFKYKFVKDKEANINFLDNYL